VLTLDGLTAEMERAGVTMSTGFMTQAEVVYRMATNPSADEFWKSYRDAFLQDVTGSNAAYTRVARDNEIAQARAQNRAHAASVGLTEDEYTKTRIDGLVRRAPAGAVPAPAPGVLFDIRGTIQRDVADAIRREDVTQTGTPENLNGYWFSAAAQDEELVARQFVYQRVGVDDVKSTVGLIKNNLDEYGDPIFGYTPMPGGWTDFSILKGGQQFSSGTYDSMVRVRRDAAPLDSIDVPFGQLHSFDVDYTAMPSLVEYWAGPFDGWRKLTDRLTPDGTSLASLPGSDVSPAVRAIYGVDDATALPVASINKVDLRTSLASDELSSTVSYTGSGHVVLNRYHRGLDINDYHTTIEDLDTQTVALDASIAKGMLPKKMDLYRGIQIDDAEEVTIDYLNLQVGDTFTDPGYMSFTATPNVASGFGSQVRLDTRLPAGFRTNIIEGHEDEYIIGRNTPFEVVEREEEAISGYSRYGTGYADDADEVRVRLLVRPTAHSPLPGVVRRWLRRPLGEGRPPGLLPGQRRPPVAAELAPVRHCWLRCSSQI